MTSTQLILGLCTFALVLQGTRAQAVPVLNENAAFSTEMTVYPDHADPNVFYVAPNVMLTCLDSSGKPRFSYQEIPANGVTHAIVQMTLCTRYDEARLNATIAGVTARNPNARFTALPYSASRVIFSPVLRPFVAQEFCSHTAGLIGDEQTCAFRLNNQGRKNFIKGVRDRVVMTHSLAYSATGFARNSDGTLSNRTETREIAIRIGGEELARHPELFLDRNGNPIPVAKPK